jgi:UDP-glucose 4-epimerase
MKCLVTGSEGFIGKNLVAALERRGNQVIRWDIKIDRDILDMSEGYLPEVDVIYHLACVNQMEATKNPAENIHTNIGGTWNIAELARNIDAKLIYTSTASVYGQKSRLPIKRTAYPEPKSDYAVAKLAGEHFVVNSGCDYTILRLSNVYGPNQTTENPYCGVIGRFIEAAIEKKPLHVIGDGRQSRDFTFVDDVLLTRAVDRSGLFNVSHGDDVSINSLVSALQKLLDYPLEIVVDAPERPVDTIRHRQLYSDFKCPTKLSEGLRKTLEWYSTR